MGHRGDLPVPSWSMKVKMKLSLDRRQRSGTDTFLPTRQAACKAHEHSLMSVALTHGCTLDEAMTRLQEEHPVDVPGDLWPFLGLEGDADLHRHAPLLAFSHRQYLRHQNEKSTQAPCGCSTYYECPATCPVSSCSSLTCTWSSSLTDEISRRPTAVVCPGATLPLVTGSTTSTPVMGAAAACDGLFAHGPSHDQIRHASQAVEDTSLSAVTSSTWGLSIMT